MSTARRQVPIRPHQAVPTEEVYAVPKVVTDLEDCHFYHTMDIPGYGEVTGDWDLRAGVSEYLGSIDVRGKRVLEIGTANGFLCFHMERAGAEVVAYDLCDQLMADAVPYPGSEYPRTLLGFRVGIRKINNGFWLCHRAVGSQARVVYATVYAVPDEIGSVDVATFGCVLLHLHNPFLALANAAKLTRETLVVTQPLHLHSWEPFILDRAVPWDRISGNATPPSLESTPYPTEGLPCMVFMPDHRTGLPLDTWWFLTPTIIQRFLAVLGFEDSTVSYHTQIFKGRALPLYTVVGHRTRETRKELATFFATIPKPAEPVCHGRENWSLIAQQLVAETSATRIVYLKTGDRSFAEALRHLGVEVIETRAATLAARDLLGGTYNLAVCLGALEPLSPEAAEHVLAQVCEKTDDVVFCDARSRSWWTGWFGHHGFYPDLDFDARFLEPSAVRFRRMRGPEPGSADRLTTPGTPPELHERRLADLETRLSAMEATIGWRLLERLRRVRDRAMPAGTTRRKGYVVLSRVARVLLSGRSRRNPR
jgi:SAM-dependent methyltransferase